MSLAPKKVHMIGIAGKGMSGLAVMLKHEGWTVTGSDEGAFGAPVDYLAAANITFAAEHHPDNIPSDVELIIIGKHAKLTEKNPEVAAAIKTGVPIRSFAEVLGEITQGRTNIVVAGSYAKSTCTSLLAWCLTHSHIDAGYFVGASPIDLPATAHVGTSEHFVLEGDEYPTSNTDAKSKFLFYHPQHVLLTSGEHDHVTVFPTVEDYLAPYETLLKQESLQGTVVGCIDNPNVSELLTKTNARTIAYSLTDQTVWHARSVNRDQAATTFELWNADDKITDMKTVLLGDYNIQNIVGVSAMLLENKMVTPNQLVSAIAVFRGVRGRLDIKNPGSAIPVYESYGSSYTKARSSIEAVLKQYPDKKLHIIFEPHTFTWRDPSQLDRYNEVFAGARSVILFKTPISHGKDISGQLSLEQMSERVAAAGIETHIAENADEALRHMVDLLDRESVVLIITSGEIGGLTYSVPELIQKKF